MIFALPRRRGTARRIFAAVSPAAVSLFAFAPVLAQAPAVPAPAPTVSAPIPPAVPAPPAAPAPNIPAPVPPPPAAAAAPAPKPVDAPLKGAHNLLVRLAPQPMGSSTAVRLWVRGDNAGETMRIRLYAAPATDSAREAALTAPDWLSAPIPVTWTGWHKIFLKRSQFVLHDPGAGLNADLPATDQPPASSDSAAPHWAEIDAIGLETGVPAAAVINVDDIAWVSPSATGGDSINTTVTDFEAGNVAAWQSVGTAAQKQALAYGVTTDPKEVHSGRVAFRIAVTSPAAARVPLYAAAQHMMTQAHHPYLVWAPANRFDPILSTSLPPIIGADNELTVEAAPDQIYGTGLCFYSAKTLSDVTVTMPADLQGVGHALSRSAVDVRIVKARNEPGGGLIRDDDFSSLVPDILVKDNRIPLTGLSTVVPLTGNPVTDIPANTAKEFWVTISVPHDAKPGDYLGHLLISGHGLAAAVPVTLSLDVLPYDLESPAKQYAINFRSRLDTPPAVLPSPGGHHLVTDYVSTALLGAQLADIAAHGFQITTLYDSPQTLWTALDQYEANGMTAPYLYMGNQSLHTIEKQRLAHHAPSFLYFVDPNLLGRTARIKALDKRGLSVMTYVTKLSDFKALQADISVPIYNENSDYSQELIQSHGKRLFNNQDWWYWPAAQDSPLTDRLDAGWSLWRANLYGAFLSDYQTAFGTDPYDLDSAGAAPSNAMLRSQMLTYPVQGGVLDTLRWEAVREGVVDVRYLTTLFDYYRQCKDAHIAAPITVQAMAYVNLFLDKSPEALSDADLDAARTEMAHFTILLHNALTAYDKKNHLTP